MDIKLDYQCLMYKVEKYITEKCQIVITWLQTTQEYLRVILSWQLSWRFSANGATEIRQVDKYIEKECGKENEEDEEALILMRQLRDSWMCNRDEHIKTYYSTMNILDHSGAVDTQQTKPQHSGQYM